MAWQKESAVGLLFKLPYILVVVPLRSMLLWRRLGSLWVILPRWNTGEATQRELNRQRGEYKISTRNTELLSDKLNSMRKIWGFVAQVLRMKLGHLGKWNLAMNPKKDQEITLGTHASNYFCQHTVFFGFFRYFFLPLWRKFTGLFWPNSVQNIVWYLHFHRKINKPTVLIFMNSNVM